MHNLTVLAFDNPTQAFQLREALLGLQSPSLFEPAEVAVVTRDTTDKVDRHLAGGTVSDCAPAGSITGLIAGAFSRSRHLTIDSYIP